MSDVVPERAVLAPTYAPRLVASLIVLVGLLDVGTVLRPGLVRRLEFVGEVLPGVLVSASAGVSVAVGLLLLGLAQGIARGKHRAWRIAVALLSAQVVLQAAQHRTLLFAASTGLLLLLVVTRHQFVGRSDPATRGQVVRSAGVLVGVSIVTGLVAVALLARQEHVRAGAGGLLVAVAQGLVGIPSIVTAPESRQSDAVYYLLLAMGVMTVAVTGFLALRSSARTPAHTGTDDRDVRALLARYGSQDSLAYFATREDRALAWSPNRKACVSFKVVSGTALAAGDPIGPRAEWGGAMAEFLSTAREHAWIPATAAASAEGARAWGDLGGFSSLEFGDEAVLRRGGFTLAGREMRNARQAAARATRAGYVVSVARLGDVDPSRAALLRDRAERWRAGGTERGFSMSLGRIDPARDPSSLVVTAALGSTLHALLVLVPWGSDGVSLDLMRRSVDAGNGVTELMIVTLMARLDELGLDRVSLNFAVFRDAIERAEAADARVWVRVWGRTLKGMSRWSQVDSLYRFNAKFHPDWQPRFLVYRSASGLPRVALSYLDAESFVRLPGRRVGLSTSS
jgi:lysyl-tRNA synthetase class 2